MCILLIFLAYVYHDAWLRECEVHKCSLSLHLEPIHVVYTSWMIPIPTQLPLQMGLKALCGQYGLGPYLFTKIAPGAHPQTVYVTNDAHPNPS